MKVLQQMAQLMAVNVETLLVVGIGWWSARFFNLHYPMAYDWSLVTYSLALLIILRSWYLVFRSLFRAQRASELEQKDNDHEKK